METSAVATVEGAIERLAVLHERTNCVAAWDEHARDNAAVLDAQRVADEPVAQVHAPRRLPYGFHGNWAPYAG